MTKNNIMTPAVLVDLDLLEKNLEEVSQVAKKFGKRLWPMIKTHKCLEIAKMQHNKGSNGFLCGTVEEADAAPISSVGSGQISPEWVDGLNRN